VSNAFAEEEIESKPALALERDLAIISNKSISWLVVIEKQCFL
jgi:hypothetical protein